MSKILKPGTDNQKPGTYTLVGPRGGQPTSPREVNIGRGDRLPPTPLPNQGWTKK